MRKIIISGGPHTGKTTLLNKLKERHPYIHYVSESATNVIEKEKRKELEDSNYVGKFPWNNYPEFGKLVIQESLILESEIPQETKIVILDRSLIDTLAYARLENCDFLIPSVKSLIESANYDTVLFCDFVGEYSATDIRHEDEEKARKTHNYLLRAYDESDLKLVHIPSVSVEDRVGLVSKLL